MKKPYQIRLEHDMIGDLRELAKLNGTNVNHEIRVFIKNGLENINTIKKVAKIEHVTPYIPFDAEMQYNDSDITFILTIGSILFHERAKLILRPLEEVNKVLDAEGFVLSHKYPILEEVVYGDFRVKNLKWYVIQDLLRYHFDIFGLLPKGLAKQKINDLIF